MIDPGLREPRRKDFRLLPGSPCVNFTPAPVQPPPVRVSKKPKRPVRLRASAPALWAGGHVRLRAYLTPAAAGAAGSQQAFLRLYRAGLSRRVGAMVLRDGSYSLGLELRKVGRSASRRFGEAPVRRGPRTLRLRAFVRGAGYSNIVQVRVRR